MTYLQLMEVTQVGAWSKGRRGCSCITLPECSCRGEEWKIKWKLAVSPAEGHPLRHRTHAIGLALANRKTRGSGFSNSISRRVPPGGLWRQGHENKLQLNVFPSKMSNPHSGRKRQFISLLLITGHLFQFKIFVQSRSNELNLSYFRNF
jgi:hypothetical protein